MPLNPTIKTKKHDERKNDNKKEVFFLPSKLFKTNVWTQVKNLNQSPLESLILIVQCFYQRNRSQSDRHLHKQTSK